MWTSSVVGTAVSSSVASKGGRGVTQAAQPEGRPATGDQFRENGTVRPKCQGAVLSDFGGAERRVWRSRSNAPGRDGLPEAGEQSPQLVAAFLKPGTPPPGAGPGGVWGDRCAN
jgi:hypothetical protein